MKFAYLNWSFYQGNGLDTVTEKTGLYQFKCDDRKHPIMPKIEKIEKDGFTELHIHTNQTKTWIEIPNPSNDHIFGMGEQFSYWNLKGKLIRNVPREDGIGRHGFIKLAMELGTGSKEELSASYLITPFFVSKSGLAIAIDNMEYAEFDFRPRNKIRIKVNSPHVRLYHFHKAPIPKQVELFTKIFGRQPIDAPEWTQNGPIVSIMGGSKLATPIINKLQQNNIPIGAIWIQDWCGIVNQSIANVVHWRVKWAWEPQNDLYQPSVQHFVQSLQDKNIKVLGYLNPFLQYNPQNPLFQQGLKGDFFVKHRGKLFEVSQGPNFGKAVLVNLLDPNAFQWYLDHFSNLFNKLQFHGAMADFGEYHPFEYTNSTEHMAFIERYNQFVSELKRPDDFYFMRTSYLHSRKYVSSFWTGDQMHVFNKYDGLRGVLNGYLQAMLSGYGLMHSDVGGITTAAIKVGKVIGYTRDNDILRRWNEMCIFDHVMRTHVGSTPLEDAQVYDDINLPYFKRAVQMFVALKPYRQYLMQEYERTGIGMRRPMYFYTDQWDMNDQFFYGEWMLVAPVLNWRTWKRRVYIPKGQWVHVYTQQVYTMGWHMISAPYGEMPIFIKMEALQHPLLQEFIKLINTF